MAYGLYMSAAGANAQTHRLEVLSNNLANINTAGFKPHLSMLQSRHSQAVSSGEVQPNQGTVDDLGGGVGVQPSLTQFAQGPIKQTGNMTDMALNDSNSFFAVSKNDQQLLTRAGNFMFNSEGVLVTPGGSAVQSVDGGNIQINPALPYQIQDDGAVLQGGERQVVKVVRPRELGDLTRVGDNTFRSLTSVSDVPYAERAVQAGALEHSAVEPTQAMMELIEASRVYEANVRMIQTQDQSTGQLIGRILRQS